MNRDIMALTRVYGIPLYDDSRIAYDLLRYPSALVMKQSVREVISPYTLFARNHITNQDECVVRMSQLHLNPWLSVYATPENAIIMDENYPLIPVEINDQWTTPKYDNTIVNLSRSQVTLPQHVTPSQISQLINEVKPIDASTINVPDNNLGILNFSESPDQLSLNQPLDEKVDNFCMRNVKLSVVLNTIDNFRDNVEQQNTKDDVDLLNRLTKVPSNNTAKTSSSSRPSERDNFLNLFKY